MIQRKFYILGTALVLGFFVISQSKSFTNFSDSLFRDSVSNIFQEINIIKSNNDDLRAEVDDLLASLDELSNQSSALASIEKEIGKYEKLSGHSPISGAGVTFTVYGELSTEWVIDIVNEFFNSGAQAVSVNDIRLVNETTGFYTMPNGQILLNGSILSSPYVFDVIGEPEGMQEISNLPGGVFVRLNKKLPDLEVENVRKEIIQMN